MSGHFAGARSLKWLGLVAVAASLSACVTAVPTGPSASAKGRAALAVTAPPRQFVAFCERFPGECHEGLIRTASAAPAEFAPAIGRRAAPVNYSGYDWSYAFAVPAERRHADAPVLPASVHLDSDMVRLAAVNRAVNQTVHFRSDEQLFGVADYWSLPVRGPGGQLYGDCEDYALEKRSRLLAEGFDPNDLSLAIVRTRQGQQHAVLLVRTDRGEMMLDSLTATIARWDRAGYTLLARQASGDAGRWLQPETD